MASKSVKAGKVFVRFRGKAGQKNAVEIRAAPKPTSDMRKAPWKLTARGPAKASVVKQVQASLLKAYKVSTGSTIPLTVDTATGEILSSP